MYNLWIRNQSKKQIIKVNHIYIDGESIFAEHNWLGDYKTKERALEVLDEIQEMLQTRQCYNHYNVVNLIFEMPKE